MAAEHKAGDVFDRNAELFGEEIAEAGAIENAGHADDACRRQAGHFLHHPDHDVERVGDDDDEGVRAMLLDVLADRGDDLGVDADEIVAAHAGFARDAGRDDNDIGARQLGIIVRADDLGVKILDRRGLGDIERLALRHAFDDVEQHDVAEFLQSDEQRQRAANLPGADQCDLVACHRQSSGHADCAMRNDPRLSAKSRKEQGWAAAYDAGGSPEIVPFPGTFRLPSI